ncbi:SGNH/GDSL hydrolase family protein [Silvimonas amylolytica]|nr:SGNH/GDSL hydrolase family protein [Silvimonas amylolytica]
MKPHLAHFIRQTAPRWLGTALWIATLLVTAPAWAEQPGNHWVATWTASPQRVWRAGFVLPTRVPESLHDQTVRQVVRISLGGQRVRLVFSNTYGTQPIQLGAASVAVVGAATHPLLFDGKPVARIAPGATLISDPLDLPVPALARLVVNLYLPRPTPLTTFHWDGRETAWIMPGNQTTSAQPEKDETAGVQSTSARILLSDILIETPQPARTVAIIGDSITDGAAASLNADTRWPDALAERLAPHGIAVINAGISGGRLLADGMGESALVRFERDVLAQPGVDTVIVLIGINDISWPGTAFAPQARRPPSAMLTAGYTQLVRQAHLHGVRVIGATLTPFAGALPGTPLDNYYQPEKDALRQQVNAWIKTSHTFDAVIDFDALMQDPANPLHLKAAYDSGDHLHPGDAGNKAMAAAVDINALLAAPDPDVIGKTR